ncbi:MAG: acyl-CoA dehydrogenase family protein [Desulfarculaceae bacterium]|jgi:alkylation response protein AidB-like acyl-CoA dehydrogenase
MDLMLNKEEKKFKAYCAEFAREVLAPLAKELGETDEVPRPMVAKMAEAGFFKYLLPKDLGGPGVKALPLSLAREQFAGVFCPADVTLAMQGLGSYPITLAGTPAQKERHLPAIVRGQTLTTFALTEPGAGSDVNSMESRAEPVDGGWVLNGEKVFISNGYSADILVTFVRTPTQESPRLISAFLLEKGMAGLSVAERLEVIAPHDLVRLRYENLFVPEENLLGEVGQGFKLAMQTLELFRVTVGAAGLGIGQAAYEAALVYTKNRRQFGQALADFQATRFKLAEIATELDAARGLVYRGAIAKDHGRADAALKASMAKLYGTEAGFRAVDAAVQLFGGRGVTKGSLPERLYREIRALRIYEGASEIQKMVIAHHLLKESQGES